MNMVNAADRPSMTGWGRRWSDRIAAAQPARDHEASFDLLPRRPEPVATERRQSEPVFRRPRPAAAFIAQVLGARLERPLVDDAGEASRAGAGYQAAQPQQAIPRGSLIRREV